jgi:hypothetical protein
MRSSLVLILVMLTVIISCGEEEERVVEVPIPSECYPEAPRDVEVWNYADSVTIWWWHPDPDADIDYYKVYKAEMGDTFFNDPDEIATVEAENFESGDWVYYNYCPPSGQQYFYAVSAVNDASLESDLSYEIVSGTPRPEGKLRLYSSLDIPESSGYDISSYQSNQAQHYDLESTDIYFTLINDSIPSLVIDYPRVMIQDYGFFGSDTLSFYYFYRAPLHGWANSNRVEAIEGHCYVLRLDEDAIRYAKIWISEIETDGPSDDYINLWWAYQTKANNRDFAPPPVGYMKVKGGISKEVRHGR